MAPSLLITLAALSLTSVEAELEAAIDDFEFGDHQVASKKLSALLDPIRLESAEDLILARQYLGACHYLLGDRPLAEAEFSKILALDGEHRLDPEIFSPALVQFFEDVRTRTGLSLKPRPKPEPAPATPPPHPVTTPPPVKTEPLDLAPRPNDSPLGLRFIPFGVGQFANRHPVRGTIFGIGEVGLLATSLTSYVLFNSLCADNRQGECEVAAEDKDRAANLQDLFLITLYSYIGLTLVGLAEALISYPGDAE